MKAAAHRLIALLLALLLAGCGLASWTHTLPESAAAPPALSYDLVLTEEKMQSATFLAAAMRPQSLLLFGSSELSAGGDMAAHPLRFFREQNIGSVPMMVGSAHTQSLQFALYAGALADKLRPEQRKVVLILSPQWFQTVDIEPAAFRSRFSWEVYQQFLANSALSSELQAAVGARLVQLGVDSAHLAALNPSGLIEALDGFFYGGLEDIKLRQGLAVVREQGQEPADTYLTLNTAPDWSEWLAQAARDGQAASTNNNFGILNSYYNDYIASSLDTYAGAAADTSFLHSREYGDLELFLEVCKQSGLEPLIAIVPVNGPWYDYTGVSAPMRQQYYAQIRALCESHHVNSVDFSASEYETYFLRDVMHLGWIGWTRLEEAMYDFARD
ncbi:MAG: D-alanyl-lipoteichoic acid biosynthesis protein DltD [Coriobacteriales bacterium]|jgi:D-alanine transfer protein|nr:D-alanyl-lipoteichoic acid biosynthesis protein DltD [Coriobacteriales bacterium]